MSRWEDLIPRPKGKFLRVKCPECGNEQTIFDSAATKVECKVCGAMLAKPSGGKAKILGEVTNVFE